ncbi:MAG TPA: flagellar export protein FliJ [Peptococcaceae bacterium]|nr:flagellar export protein FliJ [Peptococcaceae bacterium]
MSFKFRLETSLHLAEQELDIARGFLATELRKLQELSSRRDRQAELLLEAFKGQKKACLEEPWSLSFWQLYIREQKEKLLQLIAEVQEQEKNVLKHREKVVQCRIKVEKFKRLKQKKFKLYYIEELRKEQAVLDEIASLRRQGGFS